VTAVPTGEPRHPEDPARYEPTDREPADEPPDEPEDEPRTPIGRWVAYRRRLIQADVQRSADSRIPTWAMAVFLVVFIAAWVAFVVLVA